MLKGNNLIMKHNILTNHRRTIMMINIHRQAIVWALLKNRVEISWTGKFLDHLVLNKVDDDFIDYLIA